jgi:hypothetical protein
LILFIRHELLLGDFQALSPSLHIDQRRGEFAIGSRSAAHQTPGGQGIKRPRTGAGSKEIAETIRHGASIGSATSDGFELKAEK